MTATHVDPREALAHPDNPLALQGIEFVEYATAKPQTFGQSLERLGFRPVARHRSREVLLYRQGDMNIIVNAHRDPEQPPLPDTAALAAVALRVRDAGRAYRRVLELGAWGLPTRVEVMELNIPAIHGVGDSRIYFVDRCGDFSIYDVDFIPIPTVDPRPAALGGLRFFGLVQYIGPDRMADWIAFYRELFGFAELPADHHFGVLPRGCILASPCGRLYWQLIEPAPDAWPDPAGDEYLERLAFACADVPATVAELGRRGVDFARPAAAAQDARLGALTTPSDLGPAFELVREPR
ncbi:4-hydroxyphenylpyruvate dioxygenase [Roseateles saccharophilus]|uniref:4-hydroxyphenylpyruvate dioxygenase n=1 Tax=Roseateles saccharophilus TaxID=304 RepID=A0A4R3UWH8_ROSSA|nr:4-hydroxyphenylpyruvate dioxygenase [Roseateles saccharophilus]MDG0832713.1 4-hydroxyphenylpyruvate dioxygenase [Roseateles saccharophilus]TCU95351.1 4-hydroxyphenylpyruvate dioxygenase [Roseateles saccharophilus]